MKHFSTLAILLTGLLSCKKELSTYNNYSGYMQKVQASLKDSLSVSDYQELDFQHVVLTKTDSGMNNFLRVPFKGKGISSDFVLLKTNKAGSILKGKIINLSKAVSLNKEKLKALFV